MDDHTVRGGITRVEAAGNTYESAIETIEKCRENGQGFVLLAPGYVVNEPDNLVITTPLDAEEAMSILDSGTSIMRRFTSS